MSVLSKDRFSALPAKLWPAGDKRALHSRRLPNDVNAPTDFKYLTTNNTNDGRAYLGGTNP